MPGPTKQLSLDANFVFDLAAQKEFAHDFLEAFQKKGYALVLPPTASHELHTIFTEGESEAEREVAGIALAGLTQWSIRPFDLNSAAEARRQKRSGEKAQKSAKVLTGWGMD
jgi:hypothetical protein